jgi:quinol monooxygenase YgiN
MTAFNAVRFRVKPGREQEFLDAHAKVERNWAGLQHVNVIKTCDRTYCIIAEWTDMDALAAARPNMIATLDTFRDTLEDLGGGLDQRRPVTKNDAAPRDVALLCSLCDNKFGNHSHN